MYKFIFICALLFGSIHGMTYEEVEREFMKVGKTCAREMKIQRKNSMRRQKVTLPDDACLMACIYRRTDMMDDKGMFSLDGALKVNQKYFGDDPTRFKNYKKLAKLCEKVNAEKVSDGNKGCERAGLIHMCIVENAPQYGLKIN